jgi:methylamine dehydrogenase heavy chain
MKNNILNLLCCCLLFSQYTYSESEPVPVDKFGAIEKITARPTAHWLWLNDTNFISFSDGRAHLIDGDTGHYYGSLNTGYVHAKLVLPSHYREIYSAETYYSRHAGGTRSDMVRVYDPINLTLLAEIPIPNKRATTIPRTTNNALTEDNRFMSVSNITPATSVSIVDLKERKFVGEIEIPGCTLTIPAGGSRFMSLCSDGTALSYSLDAEGKLAHKKRSKVFFDVNKDPVLENGVRYGDVWLFPSVDGMLYSIDISNEELGFPEPWSLINDTDREAAWRTGGMQQITVNEPHGLLYSIMHQGPAHTYEHAGPEIWVYDLRSKKRVMRIVTEHITMSIHASPDDEPLLFSLAETEPTLDVYDGLSGKHLRSVEQLGVTPVLMETPPYSAAQ